MAYYKNNRVAVYLTDETMALFEDAVGETDVPRARTLEALILSCSSKADIVKRLKAGSARLEKISDEAKSAKRGKKGKTEMLKELAQLNKAQLAALMEQAEGAKQ